MVETVRTGDMVYYFLPNNTIKPQMAFVTDVFHEDLISLAVWNGTAFVSKNGMHKKGCQALMDSPLIEKRNGYWDYRETPEARKTMSALLDLASSSKQKPATTDQTKPKV
jgi:hypothetical protein